MGNSTSVSELVLRWQELREQGQSVSAEELCADCPERLEELKRQIEALHSMQQFLGDSADEVPSAATPKTIDTGNWEPAEDDAATVESGARLVGLRYRPLRFHAKGGLGEVLVAQDEELSREVALKRIRRTHVHDDNSRRRFLREGEITGSLEHPGVVPVYGLTRDASGQPCYAMRFIRGQTLQEAIARFHAADKAGRALVLRQLLSRFVAVCNTLAYAHSRGVIHRDLKPSNIMLGDYGETLVIDWGLAKRLGDARSAAAPDGDGSPRTLIDGRHEGTAAGELLGTPAYMSPEQASGRHETVGPASDIYSLGATLYALLTGRPPFDGDDFMEVLTKVKQGDFPPPRQLRPDVPRGLEAICLKAMAHDPATRYATALELAADVEHWLADEPVRAYREPWTGRARRWLRRHRGITASAAGLLVAAVAALAIGIVVVNREKNRTEQQKQRAERALTAETAAWRQTREALNTLTDEVMEELLGKQPVLGNKEKAFLRKALGFYERFAAERGEDEESRAVAAEGQHRVAMLRTHLGEKALAEKGFRATVSLYEKLAADFPAVPQYRQQLGRSRSNLGIALDERGNSREADSEHRRAFELYEKLAGDFPGEPDYRYYLAKGYHTLGYRLRNRVNSEDTEAAYNQALRLLVKLVEENPAEPRYLRELATLYNNQGALLNNTGKNEAALQAHRSGLELQVKLAKSFPDDPAYRRHQAYEHSDIGLVLEDLGQYVEAGSSHNRALKLRAELAEKFPGVPRYRLELARSYGDVGRVLSRVGNGAKAKENYQQGRMLLEKLAKDFPDVLDHRKYLAYNYLGMGQVLADLPKQAEAEAAYREACTMLEELAKECPTVTEIRWQLAVGYNDKGVLLVNTRKGAEAEEAYQQAITLRKKLVEEHPELPRYRVDLGGSYVNLGNLFLARNKSEAALDGYDKARSLLEPILHRYPSWARGRLFLRNCHMQRAKALGTLGRHAEAGRYWLRAAELDDGRYRSLLRLQHSAALIYTNKHRDAIKSVEELLAPSDEKGKPPPKGDLLYSAARVYALSASTLKDDTELREECAARAIALLHRAKNAGAFKDPKLVDHFKKDKAFDALRQRNDYRKFIAESAEKGKPR